MTASRAPGLEAAAGVGSHVGVGLRADGRTFVGLVGLLTLARVIFLAFDPYPLDPEEAQYWSFGRELAFGYFSKPPLIAWLIATSTGLFGDTTFGVRLPIPFVHAATAGVLFEAGRRLYGPRVAFWTGLTYATLPAVSYSSGLATTDPLLLLAWALALLATVHVLQAPALSGWIALGASLGLGMLAKYTTVAFLPGLLLFLALSTRAERVAARPGWILAAFASFAVLWLPNLVWNAQHGFVSLVHVEQTAGLGGDLFHPGKLLEFVGSQVGLIGPLPFAVLGLLLGRLGRVRAHRGLRLGLCLGLPLLVTILVQALLSRANANWAAPMYVGGTLAVVPALLAAGRPRLLAWSCILNLVLGSIAVGAGAAYTAFGSAWPHKLDPFQKWRLGPAVGRALAERRAAAPEAVVLFDDRRLMALSLFYAGLPLADAVEWNPDGTADNHYELVTDLAAVADREILYVARNHERAVLASFESVEPEPEIRVATHADRERAFPVYRLRGFRGYLEPLELP